MPRELPVADAWREYVVTTKTLTGQVLYLSSVRKEECELCRYGTRVITIWRTRAGEVQLIYWCSSCFNADCFPIEPEDAAAGEFRPIPDPAAPVENWNGARPAIEDLERRGLV